MTKERASAYTGSAGEIYERFMVPAIFAPWARDLVALAALQPGERVLDVACGTGVVTRVAAAALAGDGRIVGFDVNPGMLAEARNASGNLPIEWREADAGAMPFEAGAFDVLLCQQGLQFMPDKPAALREMCRMLRSGGRLLLSVWRSTHDSPGWRALEEALAKHIGAKLALPPFSLSDSRRLSEMLAEAGFQDVRVHAVVKMTRFPSAEVFVRSVVAGAPTMLGPLAEQGEVGLVHIVREVTAALANSLDDEGLAFPQASNIAVARKA